MSPESDTSHIPVLLDESLQKLRVAPGGQYCDATLGGGGHAEAILARSEPGGRLLGIDRDPAAIERCARRLACFGARAILRHGNFSDLAAIAEEAGFGQLDGVLADLGISSDQLAAPQRGFSFAQSGPLDMRMDPGGATTAAALIARLNERELATLIGTYGEERHARRIARALKRAHAEHRLGTTTDLHDVVCRAQPGATKGRGIDPATRTFQALRIAVNDELSAIERFLDVVFELLKPGGTVVVIAFHSLEDRLVKRAFASRARPTPPSSPFARSTEALPPTASLLTRKPIRPSLEELTANPRARSARLRAAERLR